MNLYEEMNIIKDRPGMWLGNYDIFVLRSFIDGIRFEKDKSNINEEFDISYFKYFNWFVKYKLFIEKVYPNTIERNDICMSYGFAEDINMISENKNIQIEIYYSLLDLFYNEYKDKIDFSYYEDYLLHR